MKAAAGGAARRVDWSFLALAGLLLLAPAVLPSVLLLTEIVIWALLAMAFNLMLGYTGLLSFGHAALFGVGAYTAGLTLIHGHFNALPALLASALAGAVLAAVIGIFAIQRLGVYFVMLTLAFNEMIFFTAYEWRSLTGGDDGLIGVPRPDLALLGFRVSLGSTLSYYVFVAALFLLSFLALKRVVQSPFGDVLRAIRENEARARSIGFSIKPYKLLAFVISGLFAGLSGGLYAIFIRMVPLNVVEWTTSGKAIIMTLLGGSGSMFGPLIGAAVVTLLSDVLSALWPRWLLVMGLLFVIVVFFVPGGLLELVEKVAAAVRARRPAGAEPGNAAP